MQTLLWWPHGSVCLVLLVALALAADSVWLLLTPDFLLALLLCCCHSISAVLQLRSPDPDLADISCGLDHRPWSRLSFVCPHTPCRDPALASAAVHLLLLLLLLLMMMMVMMLTTTTTMMMMFFMHLERSKRFNGYFFYANLKLIYVNRVFCY